MTAFAFVREDGTPVGGGRVPAGVALPAGAVALPAGFGLEDLGRLRWNDGGWVEGPVVVPAPPTEAELADRTAGLMAAARIEALARVKAATAGLRRRVFTDLPGQDAVYLEKRAEAAAYVRQAQQTDEPATLEDFPFLAGEVGITAPTAWQLAQLWLNRAHHFKALGAATEAFRMQAVARIAGAKTYDDIDQVIADFLAQLDPLKP